MIDEKKAIEVLEKLIPLDSYGFCPKCDASDEEWMKREYHNGHYNLDRNYCAYEKREHHYCWCRTCGYQWVEDVAENEVNFPTGIDAATGDLKFDEPDDKTIRQGISKVNFDLSSDDEFKESKDIKELREKAMQQIIRKEMRCREDALLKIMFCKNGHPLEANLGLDIIKNMSVAEEHEYRYYCKLCELNRKES